MLTTAGAAYVILVLGAGAGAGVESAESRCDETAR